MAERVNQTDSTHRGQAMTYADFPQQIETLVTPAKNVACVNANNTLEHALLVLIKSGYAAVPVLGPHETVRGTVSKTNILDAILETDRIETAKLSELTVEQVTDSRAPFLKPTDSFQRAVDLLINHAFLCVRDPSERFFGILTRRSILIEVANRGREHRRGS